jgi:phosphotransferase system  glucose/maltose/N-acetylglucosamine-specific IIC component
MKKFLKNKDILLSQTLRSKKQFFISKIMMFICILSCLLTFILLIFYWDSLDWYIKVLLAFIIILLSPDFEDIKFIMKSYNSYFMEWKNNN